MRKFFSSALLLSAALVSAAEAGTVKGVDKRLDIGGSAKVGIQYQTVSRPWKSAGELGVIGFNNGYSVVSNESTLTVKGHQHVGKDASAYFDMTFDVDMTDGTMMNGIAGMGQRFAFVGYTYKGFDIQAGSLKAIPYQYVGKYDDVAFGAGYDSYASDYKIPHAAIASYSLAGYKGAFSSIVSGLHASAGITADSESLSNVGSNGSKKRYATTAFGVGYTKGCFDIGYAYNKYTSGVNGVLTNTTQQSEQMQTGGGSEDGDPNSPAPYYGIGASYKFEKVPYLRKNVELFGQFSHLKRSQNPGVAHNKSDTINGGTGTNSGLYSDTNLSQYSAQYSNSSFDVGLKAMGATFRYGSGFLTNHSNSALINYEHKLAKNIAVRGEVYLPNIYTGDIFNWHGHGTANAAFRTYTVDVRYDF